RGSQEDHRRDDHMHPLGRDQEHDDERDEDDADEGQRDGEVHRRSSTAAGRAGPGTIAPFDSTGTWSTDESARQAEKSAARPAWWRCRAHAASSMMRSRRPVYASAMRRAATAASVKRSAPAPSEAIASTTKPAHTASSRQNPPFSPEHSRVTSASRSSAQRAAAAALVSAGTPAAAPRAGGRRAGGGVWGGGAG